VVLELGKGTIELLSSTRGRNRENKGLYVQKRQTEEASFMFLWVSFNSVITLDIRTSSEGVERER
jgi:hypothetical protein